MHDDSVQHVATDLDVVAARQRGRVLAAEIGFSPGDQTVIAAAISEIARNIVLYAKRGTVAYSIVHLKNRVGLHIVASDNGPGIRDIPHVMMDGVSTSGGLGLGLPGARRLMDEFNIVSAPGSGTTIEMMKWKP